MGCKGCYYNDDKTEINNAVKILKEIEPHDLLECWDQGEEEYKAIQVLINYVERTEHTRKLAIYTRRMYENRINKAIKNLKGEREE